MRGVRRCQNQKRHPVEYEERIYGQSSSKPLLTKRQNLLVRLNNTGWGRYVPAKASTLYVQ